MRHLLLIGHADLAAGVKSALDLLMGPHDNTCAFGLYEGERADDLENKITNWLEPLGSNDEIVVLGDIAGGSPIRMAVKACASSGYDGQYVAFGGLNLPMAIAAIMAIEDELALDAVRDGILANGADAVQEV